LTFESMRRDSFPAFDLGVAAGRAGGTAPAAFNAANEEAVTAFLQARIPFGRISAVIEQVLSRHVSTAADSVAAVRAADSEARRFAVEAIA